MAADLDAQVEAFLRNATRQRKTEDRAIRQALQALAPVLTRIRRQVEDSGLLETTVGRQQLLTTLTAAIARQVQLNWGAPLLADLQESLAPWIEQQQAFARRMVETAGGTLTAPGAAAAARQPAQIINTAIVNGKPLAENLTVSLPALVADKVQRLALMGGEVFAEYDSAVVRVVENSVEATIRSGVHASGSFAQQMIYAIEADPVWLDAQGLVWTATLDSRVCPVCMGLDGNRYKLGEPGRYFDGTSKLDPHLNCRCYLIPYVRAGAGDERFATGDQGTEQIGFGTKVSSWIQDNPETARSIFGQKLGQRLIDGKLTLDKAIKEWAS
jgi:hypothetical protein